MKEQSEGFPDEAFVIFSMAQNGMTLSESHALVVSVGKLVEVPHPEIVWSLPRVPLGVQVGGIRKGGLPPTSQRLTT